MASPGESWARGGQGDAPGASTSYASPEDGAAKGAPPDSLRNTPSNIARLEDAIEHCAARRKYLARTKSPSDGEDVRWYFCKLPLVDKVLSSSVPRTEIVGKGDYFRFSMRDSLALEASFLEREEYLLAYWWREYAECSEGPKGSLVKSDDSDSGDLYKVEEERVGVPVKGGLYEVDLMRRHCFPVYWNGENRRVLRGHWFALKGGLDWIPLREDVSEQLELAYNCQVWHRRKFQPSGLFAARVDLQGSTPDLHALFTGVDDTWEAWLVFDTGPKLGSKPIKLRRGFSSSESAKPSQDELRQQKEEEMDDYCSQVPVGHLVFMVHGIGQRLEKANLVDDVVDFRRVTANLAERYLTPYQRSTQRVLFIPCQWRKSLKLSGECTVEKITLDGVKGLRVALGATVHDVLYYMSPIYCQHIIDSVSNQLNKLYMKFLKRNPGYSGKVSLYGHSLGSVLSYDILCHQESLTALFPTEYMNMEVTSEEGQIVKSPNTAVVHESGAKEHNISSTIGCSCADNVNGVVDEDRTKTDPSRTDSIHPPCVLENTPDNDGALASPIAVDEEQNEVKNKIENHQMTYTEEGATSAVSTEDADGSSISRSAEEIHEEVLDKDKLISSLEEEVKRLKARLAQLEQQNDLVTENIRGFECHEGKDANHTRSLSLGISMGQGSTIQSYTPQIRYTKLNFKVDTFFAVGSPLGVFLSLRNVRIGIGRGQDYWQDENIIEEMPCCRQMFNIFHPFDPVAYRVEPLVCEDYINKRPVIVPYHRGGKRIHVGVQEFTEDIVARSQAIARQLNSLKVKAVAALLALSRNDTEEDSESTNEKDRSYGSMMMERLTGSPDGRIDHMLQEKTFQHPYLSALGSHTNYWRDHDTALFILKHLYRDIPEEPPADETERRPIRLFYVRDPIAEDTPLTFSNNSLVKEFSRKVRIYSRTKENDANREAS
ncbi:phospholipase SGR2-like [Phragmites australis]|uniref:phospholipase SGR2-like n=1 Tax=Phragmites australis TaxID=29695 RepID=UPI002D76D090|nr:phospholipase SGR2-like [Phragmites australis]